MDYQFKLVAMGYHVLFDINKPVGDSSFFETLMEISIHTRMTNYTIRTPSAFLSIYEWNKLANYLERHIEQLQQDERHVSETFVTSELDFQIQALSGAMGPEEEDIFSLLFQINVGTEENEGYRVYAGAEGVITVSEVRRFVSFIKSLTDSHGRPSQNGG
jgi:hypothetical protein